MDINPKRLRKIDNPYLLNKDKEKEIYVVSFKDGQGIYREVPVTKEIYEAMDKFELHDLSELNEYDRHTEHSLIYENNLDSRALYKQMSLEDEYIRNSSFEAVRNAIELLPDIQKRRVKKYYYDNKSEYQIAKEEGTTHQAVNYTLSFARRNIKKILKKFEN